MTTYWSDKRVVVTGGAGFLGSFVVDQLRAKGCQQLVVPRSRIAEPEPDLPVPPAMLTPARFTAATSICTSPSVRRMGLNLLRKPILKLRHRQRPTQANRF